MDFEEVSKGEGIVTLEAKKTVKGKPLVNEEGHVFEESHDVTVPFRPEHIDANLMKTVLEAAPGPVESVTVSRTAGISLRVEVQPDVACDKCGSLVPGSAKFCPECGKKVTRN